MPCASVSETADLEDNVTGDPRGGALPAQLSGTRQPLTAEPKRGELMRQVMAASVVALLLAGSGAGAQESRGATETRVKSDNGKVVTMTGCVMIGGGTSFMLSNITSEQEKGDKAQGPVHTGGYALVEREGLDLGPFINQRVELTGVVVPAATKGDRDDKIEIKETPKARTTTVKVARGDMHQFLVASVKALSPSCDR